MKGLVIYKGRYGATKQYAMWIGRALQLPVASSDRFPLDELCNYDYFILGSSVYIGKLEIRKWLRDNFRFLKGKKIFLFQVAAAPVDQKEKRQEFNKASLSTEISENIESFYLPGRMIMRNLSAWDRFMLKMGARLVKNPAEKKEMLTDFDHVKEEKVFPLVERVRSFEELQIPKIEMA